MDSINREVRVLTAEQVVVDLIDALMVETNCTEVVQSLEVRLKRQKAQIYLDFKEFGGKMTEAQIEARIQIHTEVMLAEDDLARARSHLRQAQAHLEIVRFRQKIALTNLA